MGWMDITLIVLFVVVAIGAGLYFLNKWASKKMSQQQSMIERSRMVTSIYVIDKKKDKAENANLPKAAMAQMNKLQKSIKMHFVKAKVGPQIITLMCDKKVFEALPVKKTLKVGLAGIYIVDIVGMKSEKEIKAARKLKQKQKQAEASAAGGVGGVLNGIKTRFTK